MALSTRPPKKARHDNLTKESLLGCHLQPLLIELRVVHTPFSYHEECEHVYEKIKSLLLASPNHQNCIHQDSNLVLYRTLLLHLGSSMPVQGQKVRMDKISSTTSCLLASQKYFQRINENILENEEVDEAYSLVLQVLASLNKFANFDTENRRQSQINCLQLLELLLLQNTNIIQNRNQLELLIHTVIVSDEKESDPLVCTKRECIEKLLFLLSKDTSSFGIVRIALATRSPYNNFDDFSDDEDLIFYLNCLAYSNQSQICHQTTKTYFERLLKIANDETMNGQKAIECFCLLVEKWGLSMEFSQILGKIVQLILQKACSMIATTPNPEALRCLNSLAERNDVVKMMTCQENTSVLFRFLVDRASEGSEEGSKVAAKILLKLVNSMENNKNSSQHIIQTFSRLLFAESQNVVEEAVKFLSDYFQCQLQNDSSINLYADLINGLAQASLDDFASKKTKREVMKIFSTMVNKSPRNISFLVRDSKALESIVRVASDRGTTENGRDLAVSILMQMSRNQCNHRILAKQSGLLSSMISYTRGLSRTEGGDDQVRIDMKKQIILLAEAL